MGGATTGTYLDRILQRTAADLALRYRAFPLAELERQARAQRPPVPFSAALREQGVGVIAEVKRASPSKGPIAPHANAAAVALEYCSGGATAISVLTDTPFFGGSLEDLRHVAAAVHASLAPRPVLRKDFIIDAYQVVESRAAGADALLLIVAALGDAQLRHLLAHARSWGMEALVEVHDEAELERALAAGARVIGINSRDLRSFHVDLTVIERLAARVPSHVTLVGESGIATRADVERLGQAGVHAVLVGETLMRASDHAGAVRKLLGALLCK